MAHRATWLLGALLVAGVLVACGGGSESEDRASGGTTELTGGNGGSIGGNGGSIVVDPCSPTPTPGDSCEPVGSQCVLPGDPCSSTFICVLGEQWIENRDCPLPPGCPESLPEHGAACTVNAGDGELICEYDPSHGVCGQVTAVCDGSVWEVEAFPATECDQLCQDACDRLGDCGVSWNDTCLRDCKLAYLCPGETVGHDAAICSGLLEELASQGCLALCDAIAGQMLLSEEEAGCSSLSP